jgi:Domain of unknown function (DUF4352)
MLRVSRSLLSVPLLAAIFLASCGDGERSFPVRTFNMGEKVELGHIIYQVFETQWLTHIGEGADARVPQHRFFLVRLSAVNSGGADVVVPTMTIQDDSGTTYNEVSEGTGVPNWAGYLRNVKPADSVMGNVLFDAPPRHYKLRIADETGDRASMIDIPLRFDSETPEVAIPGSAKEKK